ncbi:Peptidase family M48 [Candidatus Terasakiella magnetica]|uniref:Peptidase family M48 n=1 Tax=Candidatus Terasakiella magnetica TaxID=1867952 RepID=A0A1C3RLI0_9PROT|nr:M48 family metalloprotease [Candidatus Terasakiella magnetica]SCA58049.1 Peptidase family M48 [Candidatus Terasakiella magnetica]
MRKTIKLLFFVMCWTLSFYITNAKNAVALTFIRDAEIENTIALFAKPIFDAAGLSADNIEIYLVKDNRLNAFVAGGQKLFIHTGLLQRSRTPEQVIGVIAHETGHIAGGHLSRLRQKMQGASPESILGYILGGAAVLAGQPGAASAIVLGGQDMAMRSLLQYSRTEEGSADQAAVSYLEANQMTSKGLLQFFEVLKKNELSTTSEQNPYTRSHPLTAGRISFLSNHVETSQYSAKRVSPKMIEMHARMRAKLDAYLLPAPHTMRLYPLGDRSIAARYARAQAYHKDSQLDKALNEINSLINERPKDAFFHELKGQIYFENGKLQDAITSYEIAVDLLPQSPQLMLALGRSYLETEDPLQLGNAITLLERSLAKDKTRSFVWRQLGIAYGRNGQMAESSVALAEEAYLQRRYKDAIYLAGRAEKDLKTGSRQWIQAQDLRLSAERLLKKQKQK